MDVWVCVCSVFEQQTRLSLSQAMLHFCQARSNFNQASVNLSSYVPLFVFYMLMDASFDTDTYVNLDASAQVFNSLA